MPDTQQTKRARLTLRQPSLAQPSQLVHPAPPNAGLQVGQQPKGGKNTKGWVQAQFVKRQKRGGKQGEVEHCCKHCETVLSGTNVTRLKTHLLNGTGGLQERVS